MQLNWTVLSSFSGRFEANLTALASIDPQLVERLRTVAPADPFWIAAAGDEVFLGRGPRHDVQVVPNPVPPQAAAKFAGALFPQGQVTWPVVVGGLGYGWLWDRLAKLPCKVDAAPGHRPPIYFLAGDIERLWAVLHVLDWRPMLADPRHKIFAGPDAVVQLREALIEHPQWPRPHACVRVESGLWAEDFDSMNRAVNEQTVARVQEMIPRVAEMYPAIDPRQWANRLRGQRLRVLGITSRYTTFLQYSMRDWLAAFEAMGHETRLVIESADYEQTAGPGHLRAVHDFRPDLILIIDHYRAEMPVLPANVPCVMWVQDRLPNIFSPAGGQRQGRLDYVLGHGRQECVTELGYPPERFMSAPVGVNESRFAPRELTPSERQRFACDVSFVSNCTVPAEELIRQEIDKAQEPQVKRLLADCFERLRGVYDGGGWITEPIPLRTILDDSMKASGVGLEDPRQLLDLFAQRINNALFRHQALAWVAELDVNLHLYGKGWEAHPRFKRFARGVADNEQMLATVYAASAVNLQITPFGAAHQRLFDGLCAGGFFLLRHTSGEDADRVYRSIYQWCRREGVRDGREMLRRATPEIALLFRDAEALTGEHASANPQRFYAGMCDAGDAGFVRSASTLWDEYDCVSFRDRDQLHARLRRFLASPDERRQLADAMRQRVLETLTYRGISRRLLDFMAAELERAAPVSIAA